jgi:hypothetical protein
MDSIHAWVSHNDGQNFAIGEVTFTGMPASGSPIVVPLVVEPTGDTGDVYDRIDFTATALNGVVLTSLSISLGNTTIETPQGGDVGIALNYFALDNFAFTSQSLPDTDGDGVLDVNDNCPSIANADQADNDSDELGDVCDPDDDNDGVADGDDNCPLTANTTQDDFDGDGLGDVCDDDSDGDGVLNSADVCAFTELGEIVDPANGCSIDQLNPCEGPRGTTEEWKNHGKYISSVAQSTNSFLEQGLITEEEKDEIMSNAASSSCGK